MVVLDLSARTLVISDALQKYRALGTSLVVQRLGRSTFIAEAGKGSVSGWGTKILQAAWCSRKKQQPKKPQSSDPASENPHLCILSEARPHFQTSSQVIVMCQQLQLIPTCGTEPVWRHFERKRAIGTWPALALELATIAVNSEGICWLSLGQQFL